MDKMDDFIKKRLDDQTPAEDAWNVPSDDIWNDAKVHFPKQKKERKWFWIPIFLGLLLSTGIGFYFGKNSPNPENSSTNIANSKQEVNTTGEEKKNITSLFDKRSQQPSIEATENIQTHNNKTSAIQTPKTIASTPTMENKVETKLIAPTNTQQTTSPIFTEKVKIVESKLDSKINILNQKETIKSEDIEKSTPKLQRTEFIKSLLSPVRLDEKNEETPPVALFKKTKSKAKMKHYPNQEFGIGYSETLIRLLDFIEIQDPESGNSFKLDMNYKNVNLHYTKWLSKRWSLSTGLYFSEFDLDIKTSNLSEYTGGDIDAYVNQKLNNNTQLSQFSDFSTSSDNELTINLVDDVQLMTGDSVNIKTQETLYSRIFQIPVLVNHHVYKNKFEWIFSTGASLNFDYFNQEEYDLELYKEGILINEPTPYPGITERNITISIHGIVSMRYHINRKLNFGLSSKIYFNNPVLSNIETGLYYRF